jgi:Dockerin type I domain
VVNITSPIKNSLYNPGPDTLYACTATVTDAEHNASQLTYEWQTSLRHNTHEHREAIKNEVNSSTLIQRVGFYGGDTYYWLVELTVTDAAGLSTKDSAKIFPNLNQTLGTVNGSVVLQGRPAAPNAQWQVPLTVDFYASGNMTTPAFSYNVTTDNSGNFSCTNVPLGTYKIAVKNAHTLKKVTPFQTINGGAIAVNIGTLIEGDINQDNFISSTDLIQILSSYNKVFGNPGFIPNADLNGDGFVSSLDLILILGNYNSFGQVP